MEETYVIRREEALLTLLNPRYGFHLLGQFLTPTTASEAARQLGEAASKVSYHVQRLQDLGVLVPTSAAEGRRQPLQAVARRFTLAPELFPLLSNELVKPMLQTLTESFLAAGEVPEPEQSEELVLMDWGDTGEPHPQRHDWHREPRGLHVQQFQVAPERYAALMADLQTRLEAEVRATPDSAGGRWPVAHRGPGRLPGNDAANGRAERAAIKKPPRRAVIGKI